MSALASAFVAGFIRGLTTLPARRRAVRGRTVAAVAPSRPQAEPVVIAAAPAPMPPPPSATVAAGELWPAATVPAAGLDPFEPLDSDDLDWLRAQGDG